MTASVTLNAAITFRPYEPPEGDSSAVPAHWELYLHATASNDAPTKLFLLERQRKRTTGWGVASFVRVASKADFARYGYVAPSGSELKYGYYYYLSDTAVQSFPTWDEANVAYARTRGQILSLLGVSSTTEIAGTLSLRAVGVVPKRIATTSYSMYPLDTVTFTGVGGVRPYTYSLDSETSGSAVDSYTGVFTAACQEETQVTVTVTDSAPMPSQASIVVTLVVPSSPPESEVLDV